MLFPPLSWPKGPSTAFATSWVLLFQRLSKAFWTANKTRGVWREREPELPALQKEEPYLREKRVIKSWSKNALFLHNYFKGSNGEQPWLMPEAPPPPPSSRAKTNRIESLNFLGSLTRGVRKKPSHQTESTLCLSVLTQENRLVGGRSFESGYARKTREEELGYHWTDCLYEVQSWSKSKVQRWDRKETLCGYDNSLSKATTTHQLDETKKHRPTADTGQACQMKNASFYNLHKCVCVCAVNGVSNQLYCFSSLCT